MASGAAGFQLLIGVAKRCLLRNTACRQQGRGAAVWPRGEQQIGIGVGLGYVPNKDREEKWRLSAMLRCDFCAFLGGFLGFLRWCSGL